MKLRPSTDTEALVAHVAATVWSDMEERVVHEDPKHPTVAKVVSTVVDIAEMIVTEVQNRDYGSDA